MANLNEDMTLSMNGYSRYKMRGSKKPYVVRRKGGASKEKIKKDPAFALVRKNNKEFGGCSKAGKAIREALGPVRILTNYNYSGSLNARVRRVMKSDTVHQIGQRAIYFSKYRDLLNGFYLNELYPLDAIIQAPVNFELYRDQCKATVYFPAIDPRYNLKYDYKYPFFSFVVSLGVVSDMEFSDKDKGYIPLNPKGHNKECTHGEWHSTLRTCESQLLEITIKNMPVPNENDTFILAAGIEFGSPDADGSVKAKKYSGSAKILATF